MGKVKKEERKKVSCVDYHNRKKERKTVSVAECQGPGVVHEGQSRCVISNVSFLLLCVSVLQLVKTYTVVTDFL